MSSNEVSRRVLRVESGRLGFIGGWEQDLLKARLGFSLFNIAFYKQS